ncbi:MAG: hypothetical protein Q8M53_05845 [Burkholderiales bacterium]|nr:hypothetical protein [Burkholderiales bacterium]
MPVAAQPERQAGYRQSGQEEGAIKRYSWIDAVAAATEEGHVLTPQLRQLLAAIDDLLFDAWDLGANIVLVWTRLGDEYRFLAVRHYAILEPFDTDPATPGVADTVAFIDGIFAGERHVTNAEFERIRGVLGKTAHVMRKVFPLSVQPVDALVTRLIARYSVSLVPRRAVVLLDAVGFSLRTPLEQVAMLNSISYSVNSAYRQLLSKDVDINFARTTTGDGFYIWNRSQTIEGNIALYKLVMLILADNAVARRKAQRFPVPELRAAFHVGKHYEFHQVEGLNPTTFGYIVGQVTIDLARMIEQALPGQILLGDFEIEMADDGDAGVRHFNTLNFVERAALSLNQLRGLVVAGDEIGNIRCYLTGEALPEGGFMVNRYELRDKHGIVHPVYNAKINIHRLRAGPIFLGIQHRDLHPPRSQ